MTRSRVELNRLATEEFERPLNTAIVGGGKGCESFLKMVEADSLGRFRLVICGVADSRSDAAGIRLARKQGVALVTTDYKQLYQIPDLDLIIELTGSTEIRDEIERTRPRQVRLIDHFGAALFWEVYTAQHSIIQQRTEMRERVEAEREWISQIFDSIPDEIVVVDTNMMVQDVNASFLLNNHLNIAEVQGRHCYELDQAVRGECQVAIEDCPFFEVMKTKTTTSTVRKHFDKDGTPRYAAIVAAPLFNRQGAVIGIIEATRDITRRIRAEEDLTLTEVQLQQFMEMAPFATYVKNTQGQYLEANPAACELFGKPKNELLGRTDLEILPRETAEALRTSDRLVLKTKKQISSDVEVVLNGTRCFLSTIKYPVLDAEGNVTAVCGITRDVSALREADLELTRTRDYLQLVLKNSPMIVTTTDMDGRIVSYNPRAEESMGYTEQEAIGMPASRFYRDAREREALLRRVKKEGVVRDYETQLLHKEGHVVPVSITLSQLRDARGAMIGTVGISRDISHRKALMDQVVQSERLAAVGRLAAGVAHEINNPLAVIGEIAGYLQELLTEDPGCEDPETLEEVDTGIPKIIHQVDRCRSITHRLLSFARKSEAKMNVADVDASLEEILPFLEKEAGLANVVIHRDWTRGLPRVRIEEMQLQEIFINLINNAIQALGNHERGNIWITSEAVDGKVVVSIRDDGPGIPEEVKDRIFDPFVTTKAPGQGTGLGLSICYGIVKRYDGAITVDSTPGEGSEFRVILPIKD
jgi:PAS domain S-box-containing protein